LTAFTFTVLRQYHLHTLQSKSSTHDYLHALQRLTNNIQPASVPVSLLPIIPHCTYPRWPSPVPSARISSCCTCLAIHSGTQMGGYSPRPS
jgi:hypothetical protein